MYNVLVCDDEKDIVSALQIYLKSEGYQVFSAYNGKEALKIINREDIQLVLMEDRKSTRLNSSHNNQSRMPSSA